jgi:hypothetical protein
LWPPAAYSGFHFFDADTFARASASAKSRTNPQPWQSTRLMRAL